MKLEKPGTTLKAAEWLFSIGEGRDSQPVDGLVTVVGYDRSGRPPEEVAVMDKATLYNAHAVFFEAERHGRAPVAQAFIFIARDGDDSGLEFAEIHKRLWSWGGVPLVYRTAPGCVQLFRCAHKPDFIVNGELICKPIRDLQIAINIEDAQDIWWDAARIRNGAIWDDPEACSLMLSAEKAAHRMLVKAVRALAGKLEGLLEEQLRRRLLILSLLIAYLEARKVLVEDDFSAAREGSSRFFEVLGDGPALIKLLEALEVRFNGNIFALTPAQRSTLSESKELIHFARLVEAHEDSAGQLSLWELYSFGDLPVELISNIYELFVKDKSTAVYTPPALVRLMLEEVLEWKRLDQLMEGDGVILDPACGSGVFLVESFKRLVLHWRSRNGWARPSIEVLRSLLHRVHGMDIEPGAIELAAFSLCLSLCDALQPMEIRSSVKLFPPLANVTLHESCFFEAKAKGLVNVPIAAIVGNPPFKSSIRTEGEKKSYTDYTKAHGTPPDKQLAYLFLHDAMEMLAANGVLAMVEPSGFLYNLKSFSFRKTFFSHWKVREILDFVSIRGLFGKDTKVIAIIAEAKKPTPDDRILHAVFRRSGRAVAEQGFDIDYYDLHWLRNEDARKSRYVWRANLLGGSRVKDFIERLYCFSTLQDFVEKHGWDCGEGFNPGSKASLRPTHLVGKPLLPTSALSKSGIDTRFLETVPDQAIEGPRSERRFTPPFLLIKEHEDLYHGLWNGHYLTYKNEIVGVVAPKEHFDKLAAINSWIDRESTVLRAYVAGISSRLFTQKATVIFSDDVRAIPYPADENLDISPSERIIAEDIIAYQREFIRLGADAPVMQAVPADALNSFDEVFTSQINAIYSRNPLRVLPFQQWPGAVCKAYAFGEGGVDWSDADELRSRIDALLRKHRGTSLTVTRITRLYDKRFVFLLKPNRHRFWTRSVALRDADDVLSDLRTQGF